MDVTAKNIWVSPYQLRSAAGLNSISGRTVHEGALIRIESGFGCIHPWPELGDATLDDQLESVQSGRPTSLVKQSLACAKLDGEARESNRSLFSGQPVPSSHWLFQNGDDLSEIAGNGFQTVKIKIGPDRTSLSAQRVTLRKAREAGLRIRLDANESLGLSEFSEWWDSLPGGDREAVQFVEDPVPWYWWHWHQLSKKGVPLAADRPIANSRIPARWLIYKPALNKETTIYPRAVHEAKKIAVTTYLDHPVGQMWAAYWAQQLAGRSNGLVGECGLLTHRCFEPTVFSEQIAAEGPVLKLPSGTGLGFDDELEKLPWKRLI